MTTTDPRVEPGAAVPAGRRVYDLSVPFNRDMPTYYFYKNVFDPPMFTIFSHPDIGPSEDGLVTHVSFLTHIGTHVLVGPPVEAAARPRRCCRGQVR